ncbi:MAG TPA: 1,4-dihydroxy-2-naphthoate polyprenyltransferase [Candidatus Eisenbacteria bacterium]|nr:1,4-dihydroxy-2-naphthoate polyprenyltransferase [Candidatus Eisenbacteria bacterium]
MTRVPPSRSGAWLHAFRIPTLSASLVPVLVGTVVAWRHGALEPIAATAALVGAIAIQIGTNLANDLFDFRKGADPPERIGPPRVLPMGWLTASDVRTGIVMAFGIATVAGAYLVALRGWPVLAIGVASIAAGLAYTAGPWALAYTGLGDLFVFLFFGFVAVIGTYYVQTGTVDPEAVLAAIPVGALATAILVVNNLRDVDTDRAARKRTLAVLLGRGGARAEFAALLGAAFVVPLALWAQGLRSAWILLPFGVAMLATRTLQTVFEHEDGPSLNRALIDAAQLHLLFGLLFATGLALG